eukprot:2960079-Karenia_brevis.AAC.1
MDIFSPQEVWATWCAQQRLEEEEEVTSPSLPHRVALGRFVKAIQTKRRERGSHGADRSRLTKRTVFTGDKGTVDVQIR